MRRNTPLLLAVLACAGSASATTVSCTVTSGTVLTSTLGGLGYSIANGIGSNSALGSGTISCPAISTGVGTINNYRVLAAVDYSGGPFGTTSGTTVTQLLTLVGGALNGASVNGNVSGGFNSTGYVPPVPFQIGSTLSGATSYGAFVVVVNSTVTSGGPVSVSTGQVRVEYDVLTSAPVPEPSTYALLSAGLLGVVALRRRK